MTISTHVLDAVLGRPAVGVAISLHHIEDGQLTQVGSGVTDADGRCPALGGVDLVRGTYRIQFETGAYFAARNVPAFYPVVDITFDVVDATAHQHVPLLLSPFAFSTYRGS